MSFDLERARDPECPGCGCNQSQVVKTLTRWGQATVRRRCENCGTAWNVPVPRIKPAGRTVPKQRRLDGAAIGTLLLKQLEKSLREQAKDE